MKKKLAFLTSLLLLLITTIACETGSVMVPVTRYQPKTEDEAAIQTLFMIRQNAFRAGDEETVLAMMHEEGRYQSFSDMCTKEQWGTEKLPGLIEEGRDIEFGNLKINIIGSAAIATCIAATPRWRIDATFELVKESGEWLIKGWTYTPID